MREIILQEFVTLDGRAAGQDGNTDFIPASVQGDTSFGDQQSALLDTIDTILLGSTTYQLFAGYWPNVTEGDDREFADKLNAMQKVVFSRTLERAPWGDWPEARIVTRSALGEVEELKSQSGKDLIIWGSISLAQSLMNGGLVDEYRLVVCPVVLGSGRPLFGDNVRSTDLTLTNAQVHDRGAVSLTYGKPGVS